MAQITHTIDRLQLLELYRAMIAAREIDRVEQELTRRGEAFFHVSGAGHEATATLALHLTEADWLHCHYRDKALLLARGVTARSFFDSLYCKQASHSRGRQMSAHMSDPALHVLSMVGPVGNNALQAVGVASAVKQRAGDPIVLCSVGDGTTQQGEFLEAVAEAVRSGLPVLFLIEDNRWAISSQTRRKTFYSHPAGEPDEFYGIPIQRIDGRDPLAAEREFGAVVSRMRQDRNPALVVLDVERLTSHTNADDQTIYREAAEIRAAEMSGDPIERMTRDLLEMGLVEYELHEIREDVRRRVLEAEAASAASPDPAPTLTASAPLPTTLTLASSQTRGVATNERLVMRDALREVLRHRLEIDSRVTLFGEDIEDPKGDVFGVTRGLSSQFGERVANSPLSESTIVGVSIGRALTGERPVAFLQFADFLPLAYNQIVSELGSMYWRTDGGWQAPVILMVACGGYRPGLGPFHAQSFESVMAHTPGIDVFMPSTAADAAGLLNAAFESGRPTVFFYPKSCLNDPEQTTSADVARQLAPIGPLRVARGGHDITLVGWGNALRLCLRAAAELDKANIDAEVLDLRTLAPWDQDGVLASVEKTSRLIVVHEDNHTCGLGAEILATVAEKARGPIAMRRVTRPDTYVPCNFANQIEVLPSLKRVLQSAAELLDLELRWIAPPVNDESGIAFVETIGSGPSDETVEVVEFYVKVGDKVQRGDAVASLEATKSVFDLMSPISGEVVELLAAEGETLSVGARLLKFCSEGTPRRPKPITQESPGTPVFTPREQTTSVVRKASPGPSRTRQVGLSSIGVVEGGRRVSNEQLLAQLNGAARGTAADILRLTGIERRCWVEQGENAVSLAVRAAWKTLEQQRLAPRDLSLIICSTTSPPSVSPSTACKVLAGLTGENGDLMVQAQDVNAACSGYLYALQSGFDYLQSKPEGRVLVVTTEVLSPLLDPGDFDTAILFGDAATATVLYGEAHLDRATALLHRPELSAKGDVGEALTVPLAGSGYIQMKGRTVFTEAVRAMNSSLNRACRREGIKVEDLRLVVPHQANQRITDAVQHRIKTEVFSNIRQHGNTSSSSIPICLQQILPELAAGERIGLCAFGGGFTFGAAILEAP
ncbi:MAG: thiamine pyrophosphate-dependent enzyme [Pirellulaceae bacterium]